MYTSRLKRQRPKKHREIGIIDIHGCRYTLIFISYRVGIRYQVITYVMHVAGLLFK